MRFSILVPVYNVETYLKQCIESILTQSYQDYEVILVDDGSNDYSGEICDSYVRNFPEKVKVIHKENQGLISARRVGISQASGEFCVFVDSDDFIEENLLEILNYGFNSDIELDMIIYSFQYYRNGKVEKRPVGMELEHKTWTGNQKKELYEKLVTTSQITSIWSKAIRTSVLQADPTDYGKYYKKNMAEDLLQSLYPITEARKIMYVDKALYNYRMNEESISRSYRPETIPNKNTLHVYKKVLEYLPIWQLDNEEMYKKLYAKWFNETMYTMSKYYETAKTKEDKQKIIDFDWEQMLPKKIGDIGNNQYVNSDYRKLYTWIEEKDTGVIDRYFFNKNCYQKWKKIKRKLKR